MNLDRNDPSNILLSLDYYALRCGQYNWLSRFVTEFEEKELVYFPNFCFSVALAEYYMSELRKKKEKKIENKEIQSYSSSTPDG